MPILKKTTATPGIRTGTHSKPDTIPGLSKTNGGDGKKSAKDAFAERYNSTEANEKGAYVPPPPGTYEVLITEAQYINEDPKEFVYLEVTIVNHETLDGKTARIYYTFTDEDGNAATGLPYFKSHMIMLGYADDLTSIDELQHRLAEIAEQQIWAVIDVKKKGKWTNVYLSSVPENQDEKPSL